MSLATLKDDLLREFREERTMIKEQMELLDPLATSLRKPAAQRLLSSGTLIIAEVSCYIVSIGGIAFVALMHVIYPFNALHDMLYNSVVRNTIGNEQMLYLVLAVYGLAIVGVALMFIVGRMAREMRLKNDILHLAGRDIKTIVGQHLERKASIDTIEQRHMLGEVADVSISQPRNEQPNNVHVPSAAFRKPMPGKLSEIPNPGFGY